MDDHDNEKWHQQQFVLCSSQTCSPLLLPKEDICWQGSKESLRLRGVGQKLGLLLPC